MGIAFDRLREKIYEFNKVEKVSPTWVKMHPRVHMQLKHDIEPAMTNTQPVIPSPIMGLEVRIDSSKGEDYLEVGRGETPEGSVIWN